MKKSLHDLNWLFTLIFAGALCFGMGHLWSTYRNADFKTGYQEGYLEGVDEMSVVVKSEVCKSTEKKRRNIL